MLGRAKTKAAFAVACALNAFFHTGAADAATLTWDLSPATSGDWFQATNWSPDLVPSASDQAVISNQGTTLLNSGTAAVNALTLGQPTTASSPRLARSPPGTSPSTPPARTN